MAKNIEIERKFLVRNEDFMSDVVREFEIEQGYISRRAGSTVRVRIRDERAFLTIKSEANGNGFSRFEWEKEVDIADGKELLALCEQPLIVKTRYVIPATSSNPEAKVQWEVDRFLSGKQKGLLLAEIELPTEDCPFDKPSWIGDEVTGKPEYYNANM